MNILSKINKLFVGVILLLGHLSIAQTPNMNAFFDEMWSDDQTQKLTDCTLKSDNQVKMELRLNTGFHVPLMLGLISGTTPRKISFIVKTPIEIMAEEIVGDSSIKGQFSFETGSLELTGKPAEIFTCDLKK